VRRDGWPVCDNLDRWPDPLSGPPMRPSLTSSSHKPSRVGSLTKRTTPSRENWVHL
jgi:hypothetical protein